MTIGQFELRINTKILFKKNFAKSSNWSIGRNFPFVTLSLRIPSVTFPIQKLNDWGEWERLFCISIPTLIQISHCDGISWEGHLMLLGFGVSIIWQYGY